jgi:hypothetical protein
MTFVINLVADLFPEFSYRWYNHTPLPLPSYHYAINP